MTVERDPRATTAQQCSKGLILLKKQTAYLSKALILHAYEIGTFCIDCTGTPVYGARSPTDAGDEHRAGSSAQRHRPQALRHEGLPPSQWEPSSVSHGLGA